jgi:hypothetical protein
MPPECTVADSRGALGEDNRNERSLLTASVNAPQGERRMFTFIVTWLLLSVPVSVLAGNFIRFGMGDEE